MHIDPIRAAPGQGPAQVNLLLRHLDRDSSQRLTPMLQPVILKAQEILYHPDQAISHIYFPENSVICMMTIMADGRSIETATVGHEGASWLSASLGAPPMPCQTMMAVGGNAHKIAVKHIQEEVKRNRFFQDLLTEYSHALLISSLRTGACNGLHSLTHRSARWMLTTLDRTSTDSFSITQEFLAALLGCNRPTLSTILGDLEDLGCIHTRRGLIEVTNRTALEKATCECYAIIRDTFRELSRREDKLSTQLES